jgi:hypothetical protein
VKFISVFIFLYSFSALAAEEFCPVPNIENVLPNVEIPEFTNELIKIEKPIYRRNPKASFCKRPPEMVDTLVLHHSEGPSTDTPIIINQIHLNRSSFKMESNGKFTRNDQNKRIADPWYMIGYSFVINSPYNGNTLPVPLVSEGRPLDIVGSHAGSLAFAPMDAEQKQLWDDGKITCGVEGEEFKKDPRIVNSQGKIKANVTTIGIVVVGNYAVRSSSNPNGYPRSRPRNPTANTQDMIARLACQLQKQYPRMQNIKWHNYYHSTTCPGNIKNYIGQIKTLAKGYGCDFK